MKISLSRFTFLTLVLLSVAAFFMSMGAEQPIAPEEGMVTSPAQHPQAGSDPPQYRCLPIFARWPIACPLPFGGLPFTGGRPSIAHVLPYSWDKIFGGERCDEGYSVQQTTDGGYIVLGYTMSYGAGSTDFWLIKIDASGSKQWDKTFGGTESDWGNSVQQTKDGGYILLGGTGSYGAGGDDFWLIKTDANGNKQWDRTFGGSKDDWGLSVQQTTDGGYILLGATESYGAGKSDFWLIKTDAQGKKQWDKTFGGTKKEYGRSVQQTADDGYILLGRTSYPHVWLIKTDTSGNKQWDKTFGGTKIDFGKSVQQASDGGYILLGSTQSYGAGRIDIWLIKTDTSGNEQWAKTFGGTESDWGYSVRQTKDGGYILLGRTKSYGAGEYDFWLIKTNDSGSKQWDKTFGGSGNDESQSVQQTSDGCYIVLGYTESYGAGGKDLWLIKYCPEHGANGARN